MPSSDPSWPGLMRLGCACASTRDSASAAWLRDPPGTRASASLRAAWKACRCNDDVVVVR